MTALWLLLLMANPNPPASGPPTSEFKGPAQAARGHKIFLDESNATHCATCHSLAHEGAAVGPDLARLARLNARAIVMAIRATRTQYVQDVKLKDGKELPAMPAAHDETTAQYYDLSSTPPVLRKLDGKDVQSVTDNSSWKHPPGTAGYTAAQLADVIAYIKWAAYGDTKGVDAEDTE
jgi:putative heme-binding domain-containing protein